MTRRRVSLKENPDQPHAFQPRKVTYKGEPLYSEVDRWIGPRRSDKEPPCRHCGGSKGLPIHWLEVA